MEIVINMRSEEDYRIQSLMDCTNHKNMHKAVMHAIEHYPLMFGEIQRLQNKSVQLERQLSLLHELMNKQREIDNQISLFLDRK